MAKVDNQNIYGKYSRLRYYKIVKDEKAGVTRIGMKNDDMKERISNFDYTYWKIEAKYQYRPDLIANLHYGDPRLWWIITSANNISHPLKQLEIERVLRIPNVNQVMAFLA